MPGRRQENPASAQARAKSAPAPRRAARGAAGTPGRVCCEPSTRRSSAPGNSLHTNICQDTHTLATRCAERKASTETWGAAGDGGLAGVCPERLRIAGGHAHPRRGGPPRAQVPGGQEGHREGAEGPAGWAWRRTARARAYGAHIALPRASLKGKETSGSALRRWLPPAHGCVPGWSGLSSSTVICTTSARSCSDIIQSDQSGRATAGTKLTRDGVAVPENQSKGRSMTMTLK